MDVNGRIVVFPAPVEQEKEPTIRDERREVGKSREQPEVKDGVLLVTADVTEIQDDQYAGRGDIYEVVFEAPSALERIGDGAFCDCENLERICFPRESSLKEIGEDAFRRCGALTALVVTGGINAAEMPSFPDGLEKIGRNAFSQCENLELLVFPSSLRSIGEAAFFLCTGLNRTIVIPESVQSIGKDAFLLRRGRGEGNFDKCIPLDFGARKNFAKISRDVLVNNHQCPTCGHKLVRFSRRCFHCRTLV